MDNKNQVLIIVGTRPEGIKMMPVYFALKRAHIPTLLVSTGQHTDLLNEVFTIFNVKPDIDLALGKPNQNLTYLTHAVLTACADLYEKLKPSLILIEGDTTTIMAAALAAFYQHIPVGHVEAGLRTADINSPFPEELNRRVVSLFAQYHFAPTSASMANLLAEGIARDKVYHTGNTVVDALHYIHRQIESAVVPVSSTIKALVEGKGNKKIALLTLHRRESFGAGLLSAFTAIKEIALLHPELTIIYPTHPNPAVRTAIDQAGLEECSNIIMGPPIPYTDLVYALHHVDLVLTDSGGIQEEAVSLGKSVLVLREKTERPEGIWVGLAELVGTDKEKIVRAAEKILSQPKNIIDASSVYGDGRAAERIATIISNAYNYMHINKGEDSCKNVSV